MSPFCDAQTPFGICALIPGARTDVNEYPVQLANAMASKCVGISLSKPNPARSLINLLHHWISISSPIFGPKAASHLVDIEGVELKESINCRSWLRLF